MNRGSGERGAVSALRNFEKEGREENDAVWEKFLDRVSPIRRGSVCFFFRPESGSCDARVPHIS